MPMDTHGSRLYELNERHWGMASTERENVVLVPSNVVRIVENNPRRLELILVNHGNYAVRVGFNSKIVANGGLILAPNGGTLTMVADEDGEAVGREVYATASPGISYVYTMEVIGQ